MDDLRQVEGESVPLPDVKCIRVDEESEVWHHYRCKCHRTEDDGKPPECTVVAKSIEELLAVLGSGDFAEYSLYQAFIHGMYFF